MMPAPKISFDDLICSWLDKAIPVLESLDFLKWPNDDVISLPQAARAHLHKAIRSHILEKKPNSAALRKKFKTSVISRVNNAISHLKSHCARESVSSKSVVLLPSSIFQLVQQIPVGHALESASRSYCFLFGTADFAEGLSLKGLNVRHHSRVLRNEISMARLRSRVQWLRLGREKKIALPNLHLGHEQFDLSELVFDIIGKLVAATYESFALAEYMGQYIQPKLMVLGDDLSVRGRVLCAYGKQHSVKSICLLANPQKGPIDSYRSSDRYVVFGNNAKRALISGGIDSRKISACGTPYLDAIALKQSLPFLKSEKGKKNQGKFVLADLKPNLATHLKSAAQKFPQHFILLLADHKDIATLSQFGISSCRNLRVCMRSELSCAQLSECLQKSDLVLADNYVSCIEGLSIGKQVVAIDFESRFDDRELLRTRVIKAVSNLSELEQVLSIPSGKQKAFDFDCSKNFEDYFFRRDGNAAQRIARVIAEECHR